MILLEAVGGLCNRMLAIDSAISLSRDTNKKLVVLWESYPLLSCNYTDLFEPNSLFVLKERKHLGFLSRQFHRIANFIKYDIFIPNRKFKKLRNANYDFSQLSSKKSIYIYGYNRFYKPHNVRTNFKPISKLQSTINKKISYFKQYTIGLHLRRSDHGPAIKNSPTEKFIAVIEEELRLNPTVAFFLATDSEADKSRLKSIFGNIIISNDTDLSRNTVIGIQDALVDLYCLSRTHKIYGSFASSFSVTAAEIGECAHIVL